MVDCFDRDLVFMIVKFSDDLCPFCDEVVMVTCWTDYVLLRCDFLVTEALRLVTSLG